MKRALSNAPSTPKGYTTHRTVTGLGPDGTLASCPSDLRAPMATFREDVPLPR